MTTLEQIETVAHPVLDRYSCALVLATYRRERAGWVLRLLVEKRDADPDRGSGVDHALCRSISRDLGAALDAEDVVNRAYVLEISSPGIERPLTKLDDYQRFNGRLAKLKTRRAIDGRRKFKGVLDGVTAGEIRLRTRDGEIITFAPEQIEKANLVYEQQRTEAP